MKIKHYTTEPVWDNPFNLEVIKLHDSADAEVLHLTLSPGQSMVRHIPPVDVLLYILSGEPTIELGEEKQDVMVETYIECPKGTKMCVYNETGRVVRLLIIKTSKSDKPPVILT